LPRGAAVRPSGTEDLCKIYAENLRSEEHLKRIQEEALAIAQSVFDSQRSVKRTAQRHGLAFDT